MHNIKQLQTHKHAFIWLSWDFYYIQSSSKECGARAHTHTRASILFYWLLHVHLPHVFSCMWGLCVFAFVYCKSVHSLCPLTPVLAFSWGFRPGSSCRFCPRLLCLTSGGSGTRQQLAAKPTCRFLCCQRHNERQKTWTKDELGALIVGTIQRWAATSSLTSNANSWPRREMGFVRNDKIHTPHCYLF